MKLKELKGFLDTLSESDLEKDVLVYNNESGIITPATCFTPLKDSHTYQKGLYDSEIIAKEDDFIIEIYTDGGTDYSL